MIRPPSPAFCFFTLVRHRSYSRQALSQCANDDMHAFSENISLAQLSRAVNHDVIPRGVAGALKASITTTPIGWLASWGVAREIFFSTLEPLLEKW